MKKIIFALAFASLLVACKKENSKPTSPITTTPTTVEDTTKKTADSVICVDNPKINFSCVGTPVGKFSYCIKDIDGNVYKTVVIGKQQWMAENLKVTKYNDGTAIPNVKDSVTWRNLDSSAAWCYYNNDESFNEKNGKLYNWFVVNKFANGNKNVCPTGWHIPSTDDWNDLVSNLKSIYKIDSLVTYSLKEVGNSSWISHNENATNTSLFSGIPTGYRKYSGDFDQTDLGNWTSWWTVSSPYSDFAYLFYIGYGNMSGLTGQVINNAMPLRCIKD
jgi:uncharacterized protein (TIGR02145 family)